MLHREQLHHYQERAGLFARDTTPGCALWLDLGMGKSASTLTAIVDMLDSFDAHKILVVGPLRVVEKTWPDEIGDWAHANHLTFDHLNKTSKRKMQRILADPPDVTFITCDKVRWLDEQYRGKRHPFDVVVIDESSKFKNPSARRTRAMRRICAVADRVIELTGTPAPNGLLDLWSQIFLIDGGQRLGKTFTAFKERWFVQGFDGKWRPRKGAEQQIYERLDDIVFTLRASDYLELPPCTYNVIPVPLSSAEKDQYDNFEKESVLELGEDALIEATNAAALTSKLLQFASGAVYDAERATHEIHDAKIKALKEIVDENAGKPMLVAYNFRSDAERLLKAFPKAVQMGKDMNVIDRWNRGEIEMLLVHPKSAGHGLNLQHGGSIMVWFSLTWNLEEYLQANKRLHRQGQQRAVIIHHLAAEGTIDENVMQALRRKDGVQEDLLNAVRARVTDILGVPKAA